MRGYLLNSPVTMVSTFRPANEMRSVVEDVTCQLEAQYITCIVQVA